MTCSACAPLYTAAAKYEQTIAEMSAALLGVLQPGQPFEGNATSVSEALRLRRCLWLLARDLCLAKAAGRYDVEPADVADEIKRVEAIAAEEIKIVYAKGAA